MKQKCFQNESVDHSSFSSVLACSIVAVQQQKRLCCQFVDMSAAQRGCHTMIVTSYCCTVVTVQS